MDPIIKAVLDNVNYLSTVILSVLIVIKTALAIYTKFFKKYKDPAEEDGIGMIPNPAAMSSLTKHPVFSSLKRLRRTVFHHLEMGTPTKTDVYRDILMHKIDVWGQRLYNQALEVDGRCDHNCNGTCTMLLTDLVEYNKRMLEEGIDEYSNYFRGDESYTEQEREVLAHSMKALNGQHAIAVSIVEHTIDSIMHNSKYGYCAKSYQADIFTAYEIGMKMLLFQSVKALEKSNGFYNDKSFTPRTFPAKREWMIKTER